MYRCCLNTTSPLVAQPIIGHSSLPDIIKNLHDTKASNKTRPSHHCRDPDLIISTTPDYLPCRRAILLLKLPWILIHEIKNFQHMRRVEGDERILVWGHLCSGFVFKSRGAWEVSRVTSPSTTVELKPSTPPVTATTSTPHMFSLLSRPHTCAIMKDGRPVGTPNCQGLRRYHGRCVRYMHGECRDLQNQYYWWSLVSTPFNNQPAWENLPSSMK